MSRTFIFQNNIKALHFFKPGRGNSTQQEILEMTFYPQIQNSPGAFWFFLQLHFCCSSCQTAAAVKVKVQLLQLQVQLLLRLPDSLKVHLKLQLQLLQSLCQLKLPDCSLGVQLQGKLTWTNYDHFRVLAMMWTNQNHVICQH